MSFVHENDISPKSFFFPFTEKQRSVGVTLLSTLPQLLLLLLPSTPAATSAATPAATSAATQTKQDDAS